MEGLQYVQPCCEILCICCQKVPEKRGELRKPMCFCMSKKLLGTTANNSVTCRTLLGAVNLWQANAPAVSPDSVAGLHRVDILSKTSFDGSSCLSENQIDLFKW